MMEQKKVRKRVEKLRFGGIRSLLKLTQSLFPLCLLGDKNVKICKPKVDI